MASENIYQSPGTLVDQITLLTESQRHEGGSALMSWVLYLPRSDRGLQVLMKTICIVGC